MRLGAYQRTAIATLFHLILQIDEIDCVCDRYPGSRLRQTIAMQATSSSGGILTETESTLL